MIKIPALFARTLENSPELYAAVNQNIKIFEPWIEQSGMPFFPGYTDHSPRHINDVLEAAASLITDEGHSLLNPEDIVVICMAALLHDCGMHLTQDGFRALIEESNQPVVSGFGDQPWSQLWKDFISEARRFGQDKLIAIFGDDEPLRVNEIDYENLSERNYLLIGEFVRRHHARLAHEIAIKGVPSRKTERLELIGISQELKDIAGLVARSHGLSIRSTFSYIEEKYSLLPEQHRVKSPYLMAVIRIADYIQVQSERALKSLLSVKELRSPVSRQEWRNHFSVKNISRRHNDPEAFFVDASPTDAKTFLKLVTLFRDIQRELDESWATLGEIYGRFHDLAKLGLTMRRIRSNLDSSEKFARTVPYFPIKAGFDTSGPDLLKLLVGPLYDYKYEVGIRELIQNSVDACRELADFTNETLSNNPATQEPDVLIAIYENEDGTGWITVTDKGVGMTLETITKYFLIAGASFRKSDLWKHQHMDDHGESRVLRGGRFGVGALAAFLLGEELEVKTRHFKRAENDGIEFKARIDEPNIELRRCVAPSGTTIKIWVSNPIIINKLRPVLSHLVDQPDAEVSLNKWDAINWFVQTEPRVEFKWHGYNASKETTYPRFKVWAKFSPKEKDCVPLSGTLAASWERLPNAEPYKDIYWKYVEPVKNTNGDLSWMIQPSDEVTVNGIKVETIPRYTRGLDIPSDIQKEGPDYSVKRPTLAIFDPDGICPINLQRSAIAFERMGMDLTIAKNVLTMHTELLIKQAESSNSVIEFYSLCSKLTGARDVLYDGMAFPVIAYSKGIFLASPSVIGSLKIETLYFADASKKSISDIKLFDLLQDSEALIFRSTTKGIQNDLAWFRGVLSENNGQYHPTYFPKISKIAATAIMPLATWKLANEKGRVRQDILKGLNPATIKDDAVEVSWGDQKEADKLLARCKAIRDVLGDDSEICGWILQQGRHYANENNLLKEIWLEVNENSLIAEFAKELN